MVRAWHAKTLCCIFVTCGLLPPQPPCGGQRGEVYHTPARVASAKFTSFYTLSIPVPAPPRTTARPTRRDVHALTVRRNGATIEHATPRPIYPASRPACQGVRRDCPANGARFDHGEHRTECRRPPVPANIGTPRNRSTMRRVTLPANMRRFRRILPAVRSTVGRPPCYRGNRSIIARLNRAENGLASCPHAFCSRCLSAGSGRRSIVAGSMATIGTPSACPMATMRRDLSSLSAFAPCRVITD